MGRAPVPQPMRQGTFHTGRFGIGPAVVLRRLGVDKDTHTAHGFRPTAPTLIVEQGWRGIWGIYRVRGRGGARRNVGTWDLTPVFC